MGLKVHVICNCICNRVKLIVNGLNVYDMTPRGAYMGLNGLIKVGCHLCQPLKKSS
jgi:hypothetical protein